MATYTLDALVSRKPTPAVITRGDMRKAVTDARHAMHTRLGPALDAVLRLIDAAPTDLIQQARIVEDMAQKD